MAQKRVFGFSKIVFSKNCLSIAQVTLCVAFALGTVLVNEIYAESPLFVGDFESCDLRAEAQIWHGAEAANPKRLKIVRHPVRGGQCALRMELRPNDRAGGGRNRVELKHDPGFPEGSETFVAWSIFIPKNYPNTPRNHSVIMGQWKAEVPGEKHSPVMTVRFNKRGNRAAFRITYGIKGQGLRAIGDIPVSLGEWHDLAMHIRWSRQHDGFIDIKFDGQSITPVPAHGANMSASVPHRFKLGQYTTGKDKVRAPSVIFVDEARIGDSW